MIVYAWRCNGCGDTQLENEEGHADAKRLRSEGVTCGNVVSAGGISRRCGGTFAPFAQWAAESTT